MDPSTALLILVAIAPYLIWLIRFIVMHSFMRDWLSLQMGRVNSLVESHGAVNKEELSMVDSDASSSGPSPTTKHDVFISFRGDDTRDNFTSHLYEALRKAGIDTYIDDRLDRGGEIWPSLLKAIQESQIYVIIFSKDYASSTWCLDELVNIIKCKERDDARVIIPVFYHVEPSTVRKQSGSYADAFLEHERRFKDNQDKVQRWKDALFQVANLSGRHSSKSRHEYELVTYIVKDILRKLTSTSPCNDFEGLVGMHKHVEYIEELLSIESPHVRIVGIWGMGGIGKSTIADAVFHKLKAQFESCSFIKNVRKQLTRNGLEWLLNKCLSELLKDEVFDNYSSRSTFVKMRLQRKRILLVLDDIDDSIGIDDLIRVLDYFGSGSRTIITSRDMQVIKNVGAQEMYHVPEMNNYDALQLFSLKAFRKNHPTKDYVKLSEKVMDYCKGIPLGLTVLGSFLYGRREEEWKSTLVKLKKSPDKKIFDVLKISFDGLDRTQKNIFLDLACFFSTTKMPYMKHIPDYYDLSEDDVDITVLIERSLIAVDAYGQIVMHDLVVAMGQEIVSQQFADNPDKPIRLWKQEDVYRILTRNTGTETIRCISMDMCKLTKKVCLHPATFQRMYDLRFLEFYKSNFQKPSKVHMLEGLENLPDGLRILRWDEYPLQSLPFNFCPENLVELKMRDSYIKQLWDGDQLLPNLKKLDLGYSEHLVELPDLSQFCNIERLSVYFCTSLVRVYSSSPLAKLKFVNVNLSSNLKSVEFASMNCESFFWLGCPLSYLPPCILSENLVKLRLVSNNLERLWDENQHLPNLKEVSLDSSKKLVALPDLCQTPNIEKLHLPNCPRLVQVYSSSLLYKLKFLDVNYCCKLRSLHLAGNIQRRRRSSVLVAEYNYFDVYNLSFFQVNMSLSISDHDNMPFWRLKVVSVPSSDIFKCLSDNVDYQKFQRLKNTLSHSLPFLTKIRWLHIPSSIGEISQHLDLHFSHKSPADNDAEDELQLLRIMTNSNSPRVDLDFSDESSPDNEAIDEFDFSDELPSDNEAIDEFEFPRESSSDNEAIDEFELFDTCSNTLEPAGRFSQRFDLDLSDESSSAIDEVELEQLAAGCQNLIKLGSNNRLFKVPNNMALFSFIKQLSLWRSDIVSVPATTLGLSTLISPVLHHCRSHQPIIDLPVSKNPEFQFHYSNKSTSLIVKFQAFPNRLRTMMKIQRVMEVKDDDDDYEE